MKNTMDVKHVVLRNCIDMVGIGFNERSYKRK